ncbi:MAG: DNRLRE domain-containing protein, partial [Clostridia bacterium]|nr:DNRLRE domain-containing protein [Clostridia bacterium]
MKKTGSFKLLAVFLSVLLALEVFPFAVFANGQPDSSVSSYNTETPEEADSEAFYDAVGELEELRTETGKYLRMEDGSFTAVSYPFAVHFEEDGGFVEYDNTLVLRESGQGRFYTPKRSDAEIGLSPVSGSGVLYYLGKNGAKISVSAESLGGFGVNTVSAEPIEKRESKKETRFDEITQLEHFSAGITYRNIAPGTDAEYAVFGANVKETLTLRTAPEKGEWVYRLRTEGLRAEQTEQGEILFVNEQGETIYHIPVGCAYDANGALCALNYEPEEAGEDVLLRVSVPEEWLFSPERAYPVTVDPEFDVGGHDSNYINDTYAIEGSPNETIQYGNHFLLVGYATYYTSLRMRAFIRITNLPAIPASSVVVKATMDLQQMEPDEWYSFNGQSDYLHILAKPLTNWPSGLVSWNNMPTVDNTVLDYGTACYDTYSERFKLNVTSMAKEYYTGERNVFGVCLQSYTESQDGYVGFVSADNPNVYTSLAPYYTVHYRDTKGIDSRWEYAQQGLGDRASGYVNLFNGNLVFSVDVTDPVRPLIPVSAKITYNSFLKNKNFTSGSDVNAPVTSAIASYAGYGWKFSYHETVVQKEIDNRTYLCYSDADGTELYFYDYNDGITGNYLSEDGYPLTITSENGRYVMRDNEGNSKTFGSYGLLTETADSAGNKVVYDFTGAGWMDYALYYPNGG